MFGIIYLRRYCEYSCGFGSQHRFPYLRNCILRALAVLILCLAFVLMLFQEGKVVFLILGVLIIIDALAVFAEVMEGA